MKKKLVRMPCSILIEHSRQSVFTPATKRDITALANDIRRNGLLNPVEITSDHRIICGNRRIAAYQQLEKKTIMCWMRTDLEKLGELAIEQRLIEDNSNRRQMRKLEEARVFSRLYKIEQERNRGIVIPGGIRDRVGALCGMSGRNLQRWCHILTLPRVFQDAVDARKLPMVLAATIAILPGAANKAMRLIKKGVDIREAVESQLVSRKIRKSQRHTAVSRFLKEIEKAVDLLDSQDLTDYWRTPTSSQRAKLVSCKKHIDRVLVAMAKGKKFRKKYGEKPAS